MSDCKLTKYYNLMCNIVLEITHSYAKLLSLSFKRTKLK